MSALRPSNLSNSELIRACDNDWDEDGLSLALQFELYTRFCNLAPINEQPVRDEKQLDLFL